MAKKPQDKPEPTPAEQPVVPPVEPVVTPDPTPAESTTPAVDPVPPVEPEPTPAEQPVAAPAPTGPKKWRVHARPANYPEKVVEAETPAAAREVYLTSLGIFSPAVEPTIVEEA